MAGTLTKPAKTQHLWSDIWNVSYIELQIWNPVSYDLCSYDRNLCRLHTQDMFTGRVCIHCNTNLVHSLWCTQRVLWDNVPIHVWMYAGVWCYRDDIETKLVTICSYERSLKKSRLEKDLTHGLHVNFFLCCTLFYHLISQAHCELHSKIWLQFLCPNMNIVIKIMPQCCYCLSYLFHWDDLLSQTPQILQSEFMLFLCNYSIFSSYSF